MIQTKRSTVLFFLAVSLIHTIKESFAFQKAFIPTATATAAIKHSNVPKTKNQFWAKSLNPSKTRMMYGSSFTQLNSDWSDFAYDDEDEVLNIDFADENDSQEYKAEVGGLLDAPTIKMDAAPIFEPQGR